jgi:hypothetical protein
MLKERRKAMDQVAERLFAAEKAIDEAVTAAAQLSAALPTARAEANLSVLIGQDAMESAAESLSALIRARQALVSTHIRLDEAKTQIGLRAVAVGGGMIKPSGSASHLEVVGQEAA